MSLYNHNVPFTSNLEMWSPSPSVTIDFNYNATTATTVPYTTTQEPYFESRFYHHEPVFYPSACIICGLPHHPVPHTIMNKEQSTSIPAVTTPAPSEPTLPSTLKRKTRYRLQQRTIVIKSHKRFVSSIRHGFRKFIGMCGLVLKAPLIRRHNIYPVKREKLN